MNEREGKIFFNQEDQMGVRAPTYLKEINNQGA